MQQKGRREKRDYKKRALITSFEFNVYLTAHYKNLEYEIENLANRIPKATRSIKTS